METKLTRDPKFIKENIFKKDGKVYTKQKCSIEFPSWYIEKKLAYSEDNMLFYGVCVIIIGDKYSVSRIPTFLRSNPIRVSEIERQGMKFMKMDYGPGDEVLSTVMVVQEEVKSYDYLNNYLIYSRVPWFIEYDDYNFILGHLMKYAGSKVGLNPIANELNTSFVTRSAKDKLIYFRQTNLNVPYVYTDLMNLYYSVKSPVNKISGGYFQTGVVSALAIKSTEPSTAEKHLKG